MYEVLLKNEISVVVDNFVWLIMQFYKPIKRYFEIENLMTKVWFLLH